MVDRQDIDALLIGALYGELSLAEEARLSTHLESHPTDRNALADLTYARSLVRDSRILSFQMEPPQAVSALLLQEAARRAPAPRRAPADDGKEGWFFRFVRSFAAHPAMAAAAMLVLVVGAAGVMKMRDRGDLAAPSVDTRDQLRANGAVAAAPTPAPAPPPTLAGDIKALDQGVNFESRAAAGSGFTVGLADGAPSPSSATIVAAPKPAVTSGEGDGDATGKPVAHAASLSKKGMVVTTPQLQLKDTDEEDRPANNGPGGPPAKEEGKVRDRRAPAAENAKLDADPSAGAGGSTETALGTAVAPPQQAPTAPRGKPSPTPSKSKAAAPDMFDDDSKPTDKTARTVDAPRREDDSLLAWAKSQHDQVVSLAKAGRCEDAAKVAAGISAKAPGYYAQSVATDMDLKKCNAYIAAEAERARAAAAKRASDKRATESK